MTLPDQHLTRPCLTECVLGYATGLAVNGVDSSVHVQCVIASRPILSRPYLLRPWYGCLSAVAYGDSSTMSQAEVPLEQIHVFYWEMGPFTGSHCRGCVLFSDQTEPVRVPET